MIRTIKLTPDGVGYWVTFWATDEEVSRILVKLKVPDSSVNVVKEEEIKV